MWWGPAPTIKVQELYGGLRSSYHYFVLDGNRVVHISKYARLVGRKDDYYEYEVDLERVKEKIIRVDASRSGIFC